jgi:hypothetical protein
LAEREREKGKNRVGELIDFIFGFSDRVRSSTMSLLSLSLSQYLDVSLSVRLIRMGKGIDESQEPKNKEEANQH